MLAENGKTGSVRQLLKRVPVPFFCRNQVNKSVWLFRWARNSKLLSSPMKFDFFSSTMTGGSEAGGSDGRDDVLDGLLVHSNQSPNGWCAISGELRWPERLGVAVISSIGVQVK